MNENKAFFSPELREKIKSYLVRYETKRSGILPILHAIQDEKDWISERDILLLESEFGLAAVDVREVLTFYTMYRQSPPKPYRIEVCNSVSCWLKGSRETVAALRKTLEEMKARTGKEPPFEVHEVGCLGFCGYAPVALVNKERHLNLTPDLALKLLEDYAARELPAAARRCAEELAACPELACNQGSQSH